MAEDRMLSDEILLGLINKNSGGGGGTNNYNDLSNQPQINNNTLIGNKSASDLGLVAAETGKGLSTNDYTDADKAIVGGVTAALASKQNVLTAGDYIDITNNEISVNRNIIPDNTTYNIEHVSQYNAVVTKYINGVKQSENNYKYWGGTVWTIDDAFKLVCDRGNNAFAYQLLEDTIDHTAGYYGILFDLYETSVGVEVDLVFPDEDTSGQKLIIKSEMDDALATKQNATDNSLQTTDKTVVGAINEHEGDISLLKSGFTNLDNEVNGDATTYPYADVITIEDAVPSNLAGCVVKIEPVQSGSGDPSPTNVRPITGHTEASVEVTDGDETTKTYTIALGDTIYGGTVDFDSGVMTVDRAYGTYAFSGINDTYSNITYGFIYKPNECMDYNKYNTSAITSHYPVGEKTTEWDDATNIGKFYGNGMLVQYWVGFPKGTTLSEMNEQINSALQICYELATPTTIQLTPQQIQLLKGQNTLTASTGQISVTVNGVSGSIGSVQEQVNDHEERIEAVESGLTNVYNNAFMYIAANPNSDGQHYYIDLSGYTFRNMRTGVMVLKGAQSTGTEIVKGTYSVNTFSFESGSNVTYDSTNKQIVIDEGASAWYLPYLVIPSMIIST